MSKSVDKKYGLSVQIRHDLRPGDMGAIIYLHGKIYAQEYGFDHTFEIYVAEPLAEFVRIHEERKGQKIWILEMGEKVMGSMAIVRYSDKEAQLRWLLIHPHLRGEGFGRRMVEEGVAFSRESGYSSLFLWTLGFLHRATELYKSVGFKKTEENTARVWGTVVREERYDLFLK